jgi:transposase
VGSPLPRALPGAIPEILAGQDNELTAMVRDAIAELYDLFRDLDRRIGLFDKKIDRIFHENEACQSIAKIKGVGPKTATAIVAAIGDGSEFKNGRHLAAWVGLVPRQFSSGDRKMLMGISKRGTNTCAVWSSMALAQWCERRPARPISTTSGSTSFGSGATSTVPRWQSLRTGEPYRRLLKACPRDCETTEK